MGLDVAFKREPALEAGIEVKLETRGSEASIAICQSRLATAREMADQQDAVYYEGELGFLQAKETLVRVPGLEYWVDADGGLECFIVRANKWGSTYGPLTAWLRENNIEWTEG